MLLREQVRPSKIADEIQWKTGMHAFKRVNKTNEVVIFEQINI